MKDDITKLQEVEKKLIEAMEAAANTAEGLSTQDKTVAEAQCSAFLQNIQESQKLLLEVADKYQKAIPFRNDDYAAKVQLAAATAAELAQKQQEATAAVQGT